MKKLWLAAVGLLVCTITVAASVGLTLQREQTVLRLNGREIGEKEWQMFLQQQKSATEVYYNKNYQIEALNQDTWNKKLGDQTPADYAREKALEACIEANVILEQSQRLGLIEKISYDDILRNWKNANAQRSDKLAAGTVIYGPVEYSFANYYQYLMSDLRIKLGEKLSEQQPLTQEELQVYYQKNRDTQFSQAGELEIKTLFIDQGNEADAYEKAQRAQKEILSGAPFDTVCERYASSGAAGTHTFTSVSEKASIHGEAELYSAASSLKEGAVSDVITTSTGYYLVTTTKRGEVQTLSFEEVQNRIRDQLTDDRLEKFITEKSAQCVYEVNQSVWQQTMLS